MDAINGKSSETNDDDRSTLFTMPAVERMFRKVVCSPNAFFRSQQVGDANLTESEKISICSELYSKYPVRFLARYHQQLDSDDAACFHDVLSSIDDDDAKYELDYYLQELEKRKSVDQSDSICKNRRYAALKKLVVEGEYFSDYEMRERDPLLYDRMIGQYQTENEQQAAFHSGDRQTTSLSSILMDMYDAKELSQRRYSQMVQQTIADQSMPTTTAGRSFQREVDSEDEQEQEMEDNEHCSSIIGTSGHQPRQISNSEKQQLRGDFVREMHERFLDGRDTGFDYRAIDENPEYDLIDQQTRDFEDRYFDEEEPAECNGSESRYCDE